MFPYPTPAPDINNQFQFQGTPYNKPVANFAWAVPGGLNAINTNNLSQYGYTSESPLVMSASSNGYPSSDLALLSRSNFNPQLSFTTAAEWPWPDTQHGSSSQLLVPTGTPQAREVLAKLRTCIHLFLSTRLILRNVRQKNRRHSASDCPPWATGPKNVSYAGPTLNTSCSDTAVLDNLSNELQANWFYPDCSYPTAAWTDNALGILSSSDNLPLPLQERIPRKVTELHEEDGAPPIQRGLPDLTIKPNASGNAKAQTQRKISNSKQSKKRPFECMDIEGSSDDDTDEGLKDKKRPKGSSTAPRFACPFFKHDPVKFGTSRSCVGPGWTSVHRVKEHVFRNHKLPEHQCLRCFKAFESAKALSDHSRSSDRCQVQSGAAQEEGINATQEKLLHVRAKKNSATSHLKRVEEQRWSDMYKIIFPNEEQPASPYYTRAQLTIDEFGRNIMDDFDQRLSARAGCLGIQPSLLTKILAMTRNVLQESVRSCQLGDENSNSQCSQLTAAQPQLSQPSLFVGSQLPGISNEMLELNEQSVAQILSDPAFGISQAGFWNTL
ncbi:hypothetical protein FPOAC2_01700 [Fusarium poae]|jgi:hypothetical protein|nr:hypothetical protein FPOAC1_001617 [Fusarium poae]KAG8675634.1 hypothetical protein FPOAC1_001617 [Fusarium poae]